MRILGALLCMLLLAGCDPSESTDDRILLARMNLEEGETYREANGRRPGVRTLPSGLQIEILEQGTGDKPTERDVVRVHYRGLHVDGREFDDSHRRGEPVTFALDGTIAGWAEGLQRLPVGSRARLVIPHWLAYGANGAPPVIGANETLVFEVELLAILPREGWNP